MIRDCDYFIINVDDVKDGSPAGCIHNLCVSEAIEFYGLGDMILKINESMQRLEKEVKQLKTEELPRFHAFRDFAFTKSPIYFFVVQMICSDNILWHGIVEGSTGHKKGFKSALDLMYRIACVINNGDKNRLHRTRKAGGN